VSPLPGYTVEIVESPPNPALLSQLGTWFPIGEAPNEGAGWVYSIDQFTSTFGVRDPTLPLYDCMQEFFREGGFRAYVNAAVKGATPTDIQDLLGGITDDLGPGIISAPGETTAALQQAIAQFCDDTSRIAILDVDDTAIAADLITAAETITSQPGDWRCAMFAPWDVIPGIVPGSTRKVPPCGRIAGNLARNDRLGYGADDAAAGALGIAQYATGISQAPFTDGDRTNLNGAGINVTRMVYGVPRTYGFRSLADQTTKPDWSQFASSRTIMAVEWALNVVAETFVFSKLDGQGVTLNRWKGELTGAIDPFWRSGDLFGDTPQEAYSVGVGPDVNTPATFAAGQLYAKIGLRTSSMAEQVFILIAKVPITEALAA
jgi:hypothetical protein